MRWTYPLVAGLCLAADLLSKAWARANLTPGLPQPFLPGILKFSLTTNSGAAFGVGSDSGWLMTALAITILAAVIVWAFRRETTDPPPALYERAGVGFLVGGALGNIWDRLTVGRVTDFIDLSFMSFPVFNLADVSIDIGAALILIKVFLKSPVCFYASSVSRQSEPSAPDSKPLKTTESAGHE